MFIKTLIRLYHEQVAGKNYQGSLKLKIEKEKRNFGDENVQSVCVLFYVVPLRASHLIFGWHLFRICIIELKFAQVCLCKYHSD